jgi:hypothetical protein
MVRSLGTLVDIGDSGNVKEPKDPVGLGTLRGLETLVDTMDSGEAKELRDNGSPAPDLT